ncbi:MAG: metallophosphoesterase [Oligoflexales bacterium]
MTVMRRPFCVLILLMSILSCKGGSPMTGQERREAGEDGGDDKKADQDTTPGDKAGGDDASTGNQDNTTTGQTDGTLRLCLTGDTGEGDSQQMAVAKALESENCAAVLIAGDIIYDAGISSADDAQLDQKFWTPYQKLIQTDKVPFYLVMGNHDYDGNPRAWLDVAAQNPGKVIFPDMWYAMNITENVCLFGFDTNTSQTQQSAWFAQTKGNFSKCRFSVAFAHEPYLSAGEHGNASGVNKTLMDDSIVGHFDLYFVGHDHHMEDAGDVNGTKLLLAGSGGRYLRPLDASPTVWALSAHGYILLDIGQTEATYKFIAVDGATKKEVRAGTISAKGIR